MAKDALPASFATCSHYDGDGYCALPRESRTLAGRILIPSAVVCVKHQKQE